MQLFKTSPARSVHANGQLLSFERPLIIGILNVTPDSFFDGGRYKGIDQAINSVKQMIEDGADIIDIGGYSSRPGATSIATQEEIDRVAPVIEKIRKEFPEVIVSIDTFRADVATACVRSGAHIINDISGGSLDSAMFLTVAALQVPYILMHMRGTPATMQQLTNYDDLFADIALYFGEKVAQLRQLGVKDIILDPGFGFAKTVAQNYELLLGVDKFNFLELPILGGISRKSMIYKKLEITPQESLPSTIALNTLLLERGVHILRVHDVKEAKQLTQLFFG